MIHYICKLKDFNFKQMNDKLGKIRTMFPVKFTPTQKKSGKCAVKSVIDYNCCSFDVKEMIILN